MTLYHVHDQEDVIIRGCVSTDLIKHAETATVTTIVVNQVAMEIFCNFNSLFIDCDASGRLLLLAPGKEIVHKPRVNAKSLTTVA